MLEFMLGTKPTTKSVIRSHRDLIVWQKAMDLVVLVYRATDSFPKAETYGLTSQIRRAVTSIPANIAEGFKKRGKADKVRFMNIAEGSLEECRYYLILTEDLGYGDSMELRSQLEVVSKLLASYSAAIRTSVS